MREWRALWLSVFAGLAPGFVQACVIRLTPGPYRGFIHAQAREPRHLPSNALGVELAWGHPVYTLLIRNASGVKALDLVGALPRGPSPGDVVLRDLTRHRRVAGKLTPVPVDRASLGDEKVYMPRDPALRACIQQSLLKDGRTCLDETQAAKLLDQGRLRDVTSLVQERYGNHFVAPAAGFVAGHVYAIRVSSGGRIWQFPDRTQVAIDRLPLEPISARSATLTSTWQPAAGAAADHRRAEVSLRLPAAWQPYRGSVGLRIHADPPVLFPGPWSDCVPPGSAKPDSEASMVIDDGQCHELTGSVGFPELGMSDVSVASLRVCTTK